MERGFRVGKKAKGIVETLRQRFSSTSGAPSRPQRPCPSTADDQSRLAAYQSNGFYVFGGLFDPTAVERYSSRLREAHHGFEVAEGRTVRSVGDAFNRVPETRDVLFDDTVLAAVRSVLGPQIRFLQASDLHTGFVQGNWHRDCANKKLGHGPDWQQGDPPYLVGKLMMYFDISDYAFCIVPGSHRPAGRKRGGDSGEDISDYATVDGSFPNAPLPRDALYRKTMFRARPGDAVLFDLRMRHRGQALSRGGDAFAKRSEGKLTLSLVFGAENAHSERFYSYRTWLKPNYARMAPELEERLRQSDLLLDSGQTNYFDRVPGEREFVVLK